MKKIKTLIYFLLIAGFVVAFVGCSGSKKGCGCGIHKGFVGY
jgi:hypothetical protein